MRRGIIGVVLSLSLLWGMLGAAPAAQAHFQQGANCHMDSIKADGTIAFRLSNRSYKYAEKIQCIVKFNGSPFYGKATAWVTPRHYVIVRKTFLGSWDRVWVIHIHVLAYA